MAIAVPATLSPARTAESQTARLFEDHSERLYGYCLRFLGSPADAEDAVQTTFLYAQRALERGVVPELEYAWLHSIAKNVCRWQLRTLARRGSLTTDLDLDAMPAPTRSDAESRELVDDLYAALASVPESQRRAFVLREWHGLESHEVATELGMSNTATYALLTRARRSLAKALTAAEQGRLRGVGALSWLGKLKALLAGGTAKVAATTVAVGSLAIGGVAVERVMDGKGSRAPEPVSALSPTAGDAALTDPSLLPVSPDRAAANGRRGTGGTAGLHDRPPASVAPASPATGAGDPATGTAAPNPATGQGPTEAPAGPRPDPAQEARDALPVPPALEEVVDPLLEPILESPVLDDPQGSLPPLDVALPADEVVPPLEAVVPPPSLPLP